MRQRAPPPTRGKFDCRRRRNATRCCGPGQPASNQLLATVRVGPALSKPGAGVYSTSPRGAACARYSAATGAGEVAGASATLRSVEELELLDEVLGDFATQQVPPAAVFRLAVLVLVIRPNGTKQAAA